MADPIRELIEANLKTTLEGVTVAAGYNQTIAAAYRFGMPVPEVPVGISAMIVPADESEAESPNPLESCVANYVIGLTIESVSETAATAINKLMADVKKALLVDVKRGGYAWKTQILGNSVLETNVTEPIGDCRLRVAVHYRHAYGDPYSGVN